MFIYRISDVIVRETEPNEAHLFPKAAHTLTIWCLSSSLSLHLLTTLFVCVWFHSKAVTLEGKIFSAVNSFLTASTKEIRQLMVRKHSMALHFIFIYSSMNRRWKRMNWQLSLSFHSNKHIYTLLLLTILIDVFISMPLHFEHWHIMTWDLFSLSSIVSNALLATLANCWNVVEKSFHWKFRARRFERWIEHAIWYRKKLMMWFCICGSYNEPNSLNWCFFCDVNIRHEARGIRSPNAHSSSRELWC